MSEKKETYGNMEAEWPKPTEEKSLLQQAREEQGKRELAKDKARAQITRLASYGRDAQPRHTQPKAMVAFAILELADAIREFPERWMEQVKRSGG